MNLHMEQTPSERAFLKRTRPSVLKQVGQHEQKLSSDFVENSANFHDFTRLYGPNNAPTLKETSVLIITRAIPTVSYRLVRLPLVACRWIRQGRKRFLSLLPPRARPSSEWWGQRP